MGSFLSSNGIVFYIKYFVYYLFAGIQDLLIHFDIHFAYKEEYRKSFTHKTKHGSIVQIRVLVYNSHKIDVNLQHVIDDYNK